MKAFLRNCLVALILLSSIMMMFTGCAKDNGGSANIISEQLPKDIGDFGASDVEPTVSMYKKQWYDNINSEQTVSERLKKMINEYTTVVEGKKILGDLFQVYKDAGGAEFIISGTTRIYLTEDGTIHPMHITNLRLERTGERVYAFNTETDLANAVQSVEDFKASIPNDQLGFEERKPISKMTDKEKQIMFSAKGVYINNMPVSDYTLSITEGYISLTDLLGAMEKLGHITHYSNITKEETTVYSARVNTANSETVGTEKPERVPFEIKISVNANTFEIMGATTNEKEYKFKQIEKDGVFTLAISLEDVEHFFGWDIESYITTNGEPIINIVTDNKDIANKDRFIVYDTSVLEDNVDYMPKTEQQKQEFESEVKYNMTKWGMTREEAEKFILDAREKGMKQYAKAQERSNQRRAEEQARLNEASQRMKEATGISLDDLNAMSMDEILAYKDKHPGVILDINHYMQD